MSTRWDPSVTYARPPAKPRLRLNWVNVLVWMILALLAWLLLIAAGFLIWAGVASAASLFTVAEQHNPGTVTEPSRFSAIIGYPAQCVVGIRCWTYTKATRSSVSTYPESWYLHQDGGRVVDRVFHLYVMDPRSAGWQQEVASSCGHRCFLDGLGVASLSRTLPRLRWTAARWTSRAALVVAAVRAAGKRVLPNSVGTQGAALITAAGGRGSTESFSPLNAKQSLTQGHIWVAEQGNCLAKYTAYLKYRGTGDHFACYEAGMLPWDTGWLG